MTAADFVSYIASQVITVFTTATARDAAITSPTEGMFAFTKTTPADTLSYYDGSSWVATSLAGDITSIVTAAASGIQGGATSGDVTLSLNLAGLTAAQAFGADGAGVDVTFHSGTAGDYAMWDASEEKLIIEGTNGATALDVTDGNVVIGDGTLNVSGVITATGGVAGNVTGTAATVTGAAQTAITSVGALTGLTIGSDGSGGDVTFYSDTAGDSMVWDSSAEKLTITGTDGATALDVPDGNVTITDSLTVSGGLTAPLQISAQSGTTYTFTLSDAGKLVTANNGSAQTYTVPPNSSVAFPTGTTITIIGIGAGKVTLAQGSGVTINSVDSEKAINGQHASVTCIKTATDTWQLVGNLQA